MRMQPKVVALVALLFATPLVHAACESSESAQFDFWLGSWEVTANDNPAGNNKIEKIQDGCVIRETWVSAKGGFTGTSYNYYDSLEGLWHQLWLDNQGGSLKLSGGMVGSSMVLSSKPTEDAKGIITVNRITWTPNDDGSVRQLWEVVSTTETINEAAESDGSKSTTTIAFDGMYKQSLSNSN